LDLREWLEVDGLGGFAMGTVDGPATRRYHALLCAATRPPVGRMVLVNALDEELDDDGVIAPLSAHLYSGGVVHPDARPVKFEQRPWPTWTYVARGRTIEREIAMIHGRPLVVVRWRLVDGPPVRLRVKPLISGRDYHALHHKNDALDPNVTIGDMQVRFAPYHGVPAVTLHHAGRFVAAPDWFYRFDYVAERERGLDGEEDLFCPGCVELELRDETSLAFSTETGAVPNVAELLETERRRRASWRRGQGLEATLTTAAAQFLARRSDARTIIAGFPWFTDWGRDAFISLGGLGLLPGGALVERDVLLAFAPHVREGLLPNRFCDDGEHPEYNTVDAPLWFVLAVARFRRRGADRDLVLHRLWKPLQAVLEGYLHGTRYGIGVDDDGLIHAAEPGLALTWMDARIGDWVVTPRMGKPVEIQALWIAALEAAALLGADIGVSDELLLRELAERAAWARSSFPRAFWDEDRGYLCDVVDGPRRDTTLRPNQLYALGLTTPLVGPAEAERALATVERELLTPVGLRSRARGDGYIARYAGDLRSRDAAYHEGTVWPYLLGIYADACRRVRGQVPPGLLDGISLHLHGAGLGQLAEIFDGDPPHTPRGCPAQAWSIAEALRICLGSE
jgi:predicted glycogen debranching enzyme